MSAIDRQELLSPKQVAKAIGVSESSLKRWCDQGVVPTVRTVGGHRRIPMKGVLTFLQKSGQQLIQPEVLGLPRLDRSSERNLVTALSHLTEALVTGNNEVCRKILLEMYLGGMSLAAICDDLFRPAFRQIGDKWECGDVEVYQERNACEIAQRALIEFRLAWSATDVSAPLAMGGTLSGDNYRLPTSMCELVLLDAGWSATSLGTNLPYQTWHSALETLRPQLMWVSVSHLDDPELFLREYPKLYEHAQSLSIPVVLGGQAITQELRDQVRFTVWCESMRQLESFAVTWKSALESQTAAKSSQDERRLAL